MNVRAATIALGVLGLAFTTMVANSQPSGGFSFSFAPIGAGDVVANSSGISAIPSDTTLSALLDANYGTGEGSVIYRGASGWASLAAGASGKFLETLGSSTPPAWAAACTLAGSSGQIVYDNGSGVCLSAAATITAGGAITDPIVGAANAPGIHFIGGLFSGGTASNDVPFEYFDFGAAQPTTFNTGGTLIGYNEASGATGDFLAEWLNGGAAVFKVDKAGAVTASALTSTSFSRPGQTVFASIATADPSPQVGDMLNITDASACTANVQITTGGGTLHSCPAVYQGSGWFALVTH